METDCPICMEAYTSTANCPTVIGVCGHTICRSCSQNIVVCPFCNRSFTADQLHKNYTLCSIIFSEHFIRRIQFKTSSLADILKQNSRKDIQHRRIVRKCPNAHECKWKNIIDKCGKCFDSTTGWICELCVYKVCDRCLMTEFKKACPNGHSITWKNEKTRCLKCLTNCEVYDCSACKFSICNVCVQTEYKRDMCPNNHKTKWSGDKSKCNGCLMFTLGWKCSTCSYNICDGCSQNKQNPESFASTCMSNFTIRKRI